MKSRSNPSLLQRCLRAALIALLLLLPTQGLAQPAPSEPTTSKAQYRKAYEAMGAGRWSEARRLLLELWNNANTYDVAASLGQVEYQLGNKAQGARYLSFAVKHVPPNETLATTQRIQAAFKELKKYVGTVRVNVNVPGATVSVDGKTLGSSPLAEQEFLDPGKRLLEARLGDRHASKTLKVIAGEEYTVELTLERPGESGSASAQKRVGSGEPPLAPPQEPIAKKPQWPYWVSGAVAVVGLGVGVGFTLAAGSKKREAEDMQRELDARGGVNPCTNPQFAADCGALGEALEDRDRNQNIATAGFVGLGVGAAAFVSYALFFDKEAPVRSAVALGPGHASFSLGGDF